MGEKVNFSLFPTVVIVGRANVGKSTLFNKIIGKRISIVHDSCGVTRDRVFGEFEWNNRKFNLIDTGGLEFNSDDFVKFLIEKQVNFAVESADVVLFVVDSKSGLLELDKNIAFMLRKNKKSVIVCVNKVDKPDDNLSVSEFYSLGFSDIIPVSSVHGHGTGDLLDLICERIPVRDQTGMPDCIKISVLGRPNVGKSSIVNRICNQERSIVADFSGTTRDSIDTFLENNNKNYLIIDTAGIRRNHSINSDIEKYSVFRALDSVERSDICLVIIDASEEITAQDSKIAGISKKYNKACVILVNKWDKLESNSQNILKIQDKIKKFFKFLSYTPVLYISAKTGRNFEKIFLIINKTYEEFSKRISTGILNSFLKNIIVNTPPPSIKGKQLRIYYMTQTGIRPPTFVFFVNKSRLFHFSYQRHIENRLRESFGFEGTPIRFIIRQKGEIPETKFDEFQEDN